MATSGDDPARASMLLAESVVALARAELHLAVSSARATGVRLAHTVALGALAVLFVQATFVVLVLSPVLWTFRPIPTLVALGLSLGIATATSLFALQRVRSFGARRLSHAPIPAAPIDLRETSA
ncbi:MAG TPA: hypothetical protein VMS65_07760 [Polyangiaceae bacterium]|nr:hypothetical protein [Polyangiaceae bacterium]